MVLTSMRKGCHVYKALAIAWLTLDSIHGLGQPRNNTNQHPIGTKCDRVVALDDAPCGPAACTGLCSGAKGFEETAILVCS